MGGWSLRADVVHYCQLTARDYVHALHVLAMTECPCRESFTRTEARPATPGEGPSCPGRGGGYYCKLQASELQGLKPGGGDRPKASQ